MTFDADVQAGQDQQWLKANMEVFRQRADAGDEDFKDVLEEMEARPALNLLN